MVTLQRIGGGVGGGVSTAVVREMFDVDESGNPVHLAGSDMEVMGHTIRPGSPSALYGIGTGLLMGAVWYADSTGMFRLPMWADGIAESWAVTSTATGVGSMLFPLQGDSGTSAGAGARSLRGRNTRRAVADGSGKPPRGARASR